MPAVVTGGLIADLDVGGIRYVAKRARDSGLTISNCRWAVRVFAPPGCFIRRTVVLASVTR